MSSAASVAVTVGFPTESGQQASSHTFAMACSYTAKDDDIYPLLGPGGVVTIVLKGYAKILLLKLSSDSEAAVSVDVLGGAIQLSPGGSLLLCDPTPGALGVNMLTVTYTAPSELTVVALSDAQMPT